MDRNDDLAWSELERAFFAAGEAGEVAAAGVGQGEHGLEDPLLASPGSRVRRAVQVCGQRLRDAVGACGQRLREAAGACAVVARNARAHLGRGAEHAGPWLRGVRGGAVLVWARVRVEAARRPWVALAGLGLLVSLSAALWAASGSAPVTPALVTAPAASMASVSPERPVKAKASTRKARPGKSAAVRRKSRALR